MSDERQEMLPELPAEGQRYRHTQPAQGRVESAESNCIG
jgi:hypothetical protein